MNTHAIDRPFRFTKAFCIVWMCLIPLASLFLRKLDVGPWYSEAAFVLLVPFLLAFAVYCPVLFFRAAMISGTRGRYVVRVFALVLVTACAVFGGLLISGQYTETRASLLGGAFAALATIYVKWRLRTP